MHELKVEFGETSKQLQALKEDLQILQEGRDSLSAQLELVLAKTESEELARSIAEEHLPDLEKEKTMLELEIKDIQDIKQSWEIETFRLYRYYILYCVGHS